ncbi:MAG TPA: 2-dehydropantoate 2-reductase [Polyangiaceae bacterium]|nr:2-dehydropantoate 2-reductase [Polyangiaceae bacterium]
MQGALRASDAPASSPGPASTTTPAGVGASGPARLLVVGAGAIGGVLAASLLASGHRTDVLTTNANIAGALHRDGFRVTGKSRVRHARPCGIYASAGETEGPYDYVLLATQPPQVEEAAAQIAPLVDRDGRVVCFQNGLCEVRVARAVGRERVLGAVVAWGASMPEPGLYDRTSSGGLTLGRLDGPPDARVEALSRLLGDAFGVRTTSNLLGARWSKLAINCAISTLGTIGGARLGQLITHRFVRRLALELMSECVYVARREGVRLEKVAGTVDLDWLALTPADERTSGSLLLGAKHAVLLAAGVRYRRLRSSMLAAIERGRPPAVDFLNGEVVDRAERYDIAAPISRAARDCVWQIARGKCAASLTTLESLYRDTRARREGA